MARGESLELNPDEDFNIKSEVLSCGFSTPPPPFDGRRDSLTSQTSYCQSFSSSDHSAYSDYAMPVTPTCGRTPLAQDVFLDAMQYAVGPSTHGLPLVSNHKELGPNDNLYDPFVMVPQTTTVPSSESHYDPFVMVRTPTIGPDASIHLHSDLQTPTVLDSALHLDLAEHRKEAVDGSFAESAWDNLSMVAWQSPRHGGRFCMEGLPNRLDGFNLPWDTTIAHPFHHVDPISSETILPSDAMMDDFVHVQADAFDSTNVIGDAGSSYVQSPQEVSYKREGLPVVKEEPDVDEGAGRMRGRMCIRSTGAKGVKKERRSGGVSRRKSSGTKYNAPIRCGDVEVSFEKGIEQDENGKYHRLGYVPKANPCMYCTRRFKRPEHLKRHIKSHTGQVAARCEIPKCRKEFNRNDNCIAHYDTHLRAPGKKDGKNQKMSLRQVISYMSDPKMIEKVRKHAIRKHAGLGLDGEPDEGLDDMMSE